MSSDNLELNYMSTEHPFSVSKIFIKRKDRLPEDTMQCIGPITIAPNIT